MSQLPIDRQKQIDLEISKVFLQTNTSYPEDDLLTIIKRLNIEVYTSDFGDGADEVSGAILPAQDGEPTKIYLNEKNPPTRQTFTLAHELGHYLLHSRDSIKLRVDKYNYAVNTQEAKEETEANYFAAALLMPKDKFKEILKLTSDIAATASYFGVSEAAVRNRLRWLKMN